MSYTSSISSTVSEHSVLKNTFMLLAATFAFSALMAGVAMAAGVAVMNPWIMLGVYIVILFGLHFNAENKIGLLLTFALTGWLGFTAGPILAMMFAVKPMVVVSAFVLSVVMFLGLSGYAMITKYDFSPILWQVSEIVRGGETNYVLATVTLFVSFYNIFFSLLNLFGYGTD
jgi:modulator of FtsH protease